MRFKSVIATFREYKELVVVASALVVLRGLSVLELDGGVFRITLLASCLLAALVLYFARAETLRTLQAPLTQLTQLDDAHTRTYVKIGAVLLLGTLIFLEWRQPYYFTQEDTNTIFFPIIVQAMRGFFEHGIFPTWNGYELMGAPSTTLGFYALTYPVTYLCYGVSRFLLGNEYLTIELFAWVHLFAGYALTCALLRMLHVRPRIAVAVALGFALLGYNLIAGRSWYYMEPTVAWLPALAISLVMFMQGTLSWRWVWGTALVIGLYFHSGNVQMWCYGMMMWGMGMLWVLLVKRESWRQLERVMVAGVAGVALALPLAIPQFLESIDLPRSALDVTIAGGLSNMLLPWPLAKSAPTWSDFEYSGTLYFSGGVFIFLFFLRCVAELTHSCTGARRETLLASCFPLLAIFAFILAMGERGLIWGWMEPFLPFSRFRMPFRILPFVTFFMLVSGALMAEVILRKWRYSRPAEFGFAGLSVVLSLFNAYHCTATFDYVPDKPYPALPSAYKIFQAEGFTTKGRVFPIAHLRWYFPQYPLSLGLNFPALYNISAITGSYPGSPDATTAEYQIALRFFEQHREDFYREFSVEWVMFSTFAGQPPAVPPEDEAKIRAASSRVEDLGTVRAFNVSTPATKPMAYDASAPQSPLPYQIRTDGVDIDLHNVGTDEVIIANFLYRHWFKAYSETGVELPIHSDARGRMAVEMTSPATMLYIRYCPPWYYGFLVQLGLLLAGVLWVRGHVGARVLRMWRRLRAVPLV